jgi:hypothetical protein
MNLSLLCGCGSGFGTEVQSETEANQQRYHDHYVVDASILVDASIQQKPLQACLSYPHAYSPPPFLTRSTPLG